jgi:hypothetical protein
MALYSRKWFYSSPFVSPQALGLKISVVWHVTPYSVDEEHSILHLEGKGDTEDVENRFL